MHVKNGATSTSYLGAENPSKEWTLEKLKCVPLSTPCPSSVARVLFTSVGGSKRSTSLGNVSPPFPRARSVAPQQNAPALRIPDPPIFLHCFSSSSCRSCHPQSPNAGVGAWHCDSVGGRRLRLAASPFKSPSCRPNGRAIRRRVGKRQLARSPTLPANRTTPMQVAVCHLARPVRRPRLQVDVPITMRPQMR